MYILYIACVLNRNYVRSQLIHYPDPQKKAYPFVKKIPRLVVFPWKFLLRQKKRSRVAMHTYKQQSRKTPKNSRCDEKGSKEPGTSVHHSKQNMLLESRPSTRNQSSTSTSCCSSIGSFVRVAAGGEETPCILLAWS
jgi:hypothetical protein